MSRIFSQHVDSAECAKNVLAKHFCCGGATEIGLCQTVQMLKTHARNHAHACHGQHRQVATLIPSSTCLMPNGSQGCRQA